MGQDGEDVPTKSKVADPGVMVAAGLDPAITDAGSRVYVAAQPGMLSTTVSKPAVALYVPLYPAGTHDVSRSCATPRIAKLPCASSPFSTAAKKAAQAVAALSTKARMPPFVAVTQ